MRNDIAPLSTTFTLISLVGVVFSALFVSKWDASYGFAFTIVFLCMLFASLRSMRYANPDHMLSMRK